jgi:hypothetical protein
MEAVLERSNPSAQHQLLCMVIEEFPEVTAVIADRVGVKVPDYDEVSAGPAAYPMPDGSTVHGDTAVQFRKGGKPVFFAQVEMQRKYDLSKLATLRAYHGAEVRRSKCGGVIFTISPEEAEARKFLDNDARYREKFAYQAAYQCGEDLAPLARSGRSVQERITAVAAADLRRHGAPPGTWALMIELRDRGRDRLADQLARTILEECPDISSLEGEMYDAAERLMTLPTFREFIEKREAETAARTAARTAAETAVKTAADSLVEYFMEKGETPSPEALARIRACVDPVILKVWTRRAWRGETSAQIFGDLFSS